MCLGAGLVADGQMHLHAEPCLGLSRVLPLVFPFMNVCRQFLCASLSSLQMVLTRLWEAFLLFDVVLQAQHIVCLLLLQLYAIWVTPVCTLVSLCLPQWNTVEGDSVCICSKGLETHTVLVNVFEGPNGGLMWKGVGLTSLTSTALKYCCRTWSDTQSLIALYFISYRLCKTRIASCHIPMPLLFDTNMPCLFICLFLVLGIYSGLHICQACHFPLSNISLDLVIQ